MIVVYFVILVGVLIFVHELGHFLFAKLFGVKVLRFSLGVGGKMFGFRRGETEYVIGWLPLGGYVRMLGEDPAADLNDADAARALNVKPIWQRFLIILAGPLFNLVFPVLIYFAFFVTETHKVPAVIGRVISGQPAATSGLRAGDTITAVDGKPIRYFDELQRYVSSRPAEPIRFTVRRGGQLITKVVTPRSFSRRSPLRVTETFGRVGITFQFERSQIGVEGRRSAAYKAGLRTGDLITSVDGRRVSTFAELSAALSKVDADALRMTYLRPERVGLDFVDVATMQPRVAVVYPEPTFSGGEVQRFETGIRSASAFVHYVQRGTPAEKIGLVAGDRITRFDGKKTSSWIAIYDRLQSAPKKVHVIGWVDLAGNARSGKFKLGRREELDELRYRQERLVFGALNQVMMTSGPLIPIAGRVRHAVSASVRATLRNVGAIAMGIVQMVRGAIPSDSLGSVGSFAFAAKAAADKGLLDFLAMMAIISINLGVINLLPIPILDGGHILLLLVELVKRRPVSLRAREIAAYVGLLVLITLMVYALHNDVVRYVLKK